jgi:CRISPR system Cascade subunit CasB
MSAWLEMLKNKKEDKGLMAVLRCYLVDSKKHRAYSALHNLGIAIDSESESLAAALYAMHPIHDGSLKNFGTTALLIERTKDSKNSENNSLTPTERRFQHLLSAEPGKELHDRIIRFAMLAKANEIPINFEQLQKDLSHRNNWISRTRREWATEFWEIPQSQSQENKTRPNGAES